MKGDMPAAAFRLFSAAPTTSTHEWTPPKAPPPAKPVKPRPRVVANPGSGRGGQNRVHIQVDGRIFYGLEAVRIAYRVGNNTIRNWLEIGRAKRV